MRPLHADWSAANRSASSSASSALHPANTSASEGPSTRSRITPLRPSTVTVPRGRATREPGVGQVGQQAALELGQAVPVGTVELEHRALAVGEDLGGAALRQSSSASSPQPPRNAAASLASWSGSMAGVMSTQKASVSSGSPARASSGDGAPGARGGGHAVAHAEPVHLGRPVLLLHRPSDPATSDQKPAVSSGERLGGLRGVAALPDDEGVRRAARDRRRDSRRPTPLRTPAARGGLVGHRRRTSGIRRPVGGRRNWRAIGLRHHVQVCPTTTPVGSRRRSAPS